MKPNPVKKTVEYCRGSDPNVAKCNYFGYDREGDPRCCKHDRSLNRHATRTKDYERPSWCTEETFVRVKIEPVNVGDEQYCWYNMAKCSHYYFGGKDDLCTIMNRRLLWDTDIGESRKKRPDACRKLEVE